MDAVAWYRMPRYEKNEQIILPDIGHEIIPLNCPLESPRNLQTYIIECSLISNILLALLSENGLFVLQRYGHVTSIVYLLRGVVVSLTSYPNPNPVCSGLIKNRHTLFGKDSIMRRVFSTFPTHSCGNLMFSGHVVTLTLLFLIEGKYDGIKSMNTKFIRLFLLIRIVKTMIGFYSIIACRLHYTSDVIMGIIVSTFVFIISETHFTMNKMLSTIEMQPNKKIVYVNEEEPISNILCNFERL